MIVFSTPVVKQKSRQQNPKVDLITIYVDWLYTVQCTLKCVICPNSNGKTKFSSQNHYSKVTGSLIHTLSAQEPLVPSGPWF